MNNRKAVITGSTGLIGSALSRSLLKRGYSVTRVTRHGGPAGYGYITWDPQAGDLEAAALENHNVVVHLAGENIFGLWTEEKKRRIRESRVKGTRLLCSRLAGLKNPPGVYIQASAVGYYGDRGEEVLTEESEPGEGFMAGVCREWEGASEVLESTGIRRALLRIGVVISGEGGMIPIVRTFFKLGLGGKLGSGKQYFSWIGLEDLIGAIVFIIDNDKVSGAVNVVSPNPVTNAEFTRALGHRLKRPTIFTVPAFVLKAAVGRMAREMVLVSQKAEPKKLLESGFSFKYPHLEDILDRELSK
jgi:uncharacterized protein (TIGR01777 family)